MMDPRRGDAFHPLQTASRLKLLIGLMIGPVAWIVAWAVALRVANQTNAIGAGLVVAVAAVAFATVALLLLRALRFGEERRYVDRP